MARVAVILGTGNRRTPLGDCAVPCLMRHGLHRARTGTGFQKAAIRSLATDRRPSPDPSRLGALGIRAASQPEESHGS